MIHMSKESIQGESISELIDRIADLPHDFHGAGMVSRRVLNGIVRHCPGPIEHTMETGCGLTTLLFSHLSGEHTVFAIDDGHSVSAVKECRLFNATSVEFVIAPTQLSLKNHAFAHPLDIVLLDGPHGYPFPELEYYYAYPHIRQGGVLIVDDITIPSIHRLFSFLKEDEMFQLLEVIGATAFLRRTVAPLFNPCGDGWWTQGYNKKRYPIGFKYKIREMMKKVLPSQTATAVKKWIKR